MTNTIVTVDYGTYTENIIVDYKNVRQVRNITDNNNWTVYFQGDFQFHRREPKGTNEEVISVETYHYCKEERDITQGSDARLITKMNAKGERVYKSFDWSFDEDWPARYQKPKFHKAADLHYITTMGGQNRIYFEI